MAIGYCKITMMAILIYLIACKHGIKVMVC